MIIRSVGGQRVESFLSHASFMFILPFLPLQLVPITVSETKLLRFQMKPLFT